MKKILLAVFALASVMTASAQYVNVYRGGKLVQTYGALETDSVVYTKASPIAPVIYNPVSNESDYHFDLLLSVGATTGMSSTGVTSKLIRSVSISDIKNPDYTISLKDAGVDISATMDCESNIHGAYYYEAAPTPNSDRFAKYQVLDKTVSTIAQRPMGNYPMQSRKYATAWISGTQLVMLGSDKASSKGSANNINWARVKDNGTTLAIEAEGQLDLSASGVTAFSTSGLAAYRASDNTIIYCFTDKSTAATNTQPMYIAFIDASTMTVKSIYHETRVYEMGGTAFGELQQDKMFFDGDENLYIQCGTLMEGYKKSTQENGSLIRVNKGAFEADQNYLVDKMPDGNKFSKFLTAEYIGNDKCIVYIQDPVKAGLVANLTDTDNDAWGQSTFNGYYYVLDLRSGACDEIKYDGKSLAASCGTFTDRIAYFNGKVYIGTSCDEKVEESRVYIYDILTGEVTKGAKVESGYYFNRLNVIGK